MQSLDNQGNVVQNDVFESLTSKQDRKALAQRVATARASGAVKHVISQLPNKGMIVALNGLLFEVKFVDYKRGELRLKIVGPDPVAAVKGQ